MSERFTKERLSELPALRREVTRTKRRLAKLRDRASYTKDPELELMIERTRIALERYLLDAQKEEAALMEYINAIEDATTRELFMLRYYDGIRPWQKIAFMAGDYDECYVRRKVDAYLRRHAGA